MKLSNEIFLKNLLHALKMEREDLRLKHIIESAIFNEKSETLNKQIELLEKQIEGNEK